MADKRQSDIIQIAKLYYYGNMSQDEIARLMGISRPKVSRMLSEAHQRNIVQITVCDDVNACDTLGKRLQKHFGLAFVEVVPSGGANDVAKANVGRAASRLLNQRIRESSKIGISWGTTLASFAREFQADAPVPGARIVQLVGGTYSENLNIDGRELVKILAKKLGCTPSILQAPLIVHNSTLRDLLMQEPDVIAHFNHIRTLDMAFVGIGTSYYKESIAFQANYLAESEGVRLNELGLVCDICGHQLMADGSEPDTFLTNRVVGVSLEDLRRIPLVVGLCAGHKKAVPLLAAIRGRHINALVIDEVAAIALLTAVEPESTQVH